MSRPFLALFVLPLRFDGSEEVDAVLLPIARERVSALTVLLGVVTRLHRTLSPSTEIVMADQLPLIDLPDHIAWGSDRRCTPMPAIPVDPGVQGLLKLRGEYSATMVANATGVRWKVPGDGWRNGFHTEEVLWADLLEWRLLMTTNRGRATAFRRLVAFDPARALAILERGVCFPTRYPSEEPHRVHIPPRALSALLEHEEDRVREKAISLLGRSRGSRLSTAPSSRVASAAASVPLVTA